MSLEEQQIRIGQMVMDRADANRKRALLQQEIKQYADKFSSLHISLTRLDAPPTIDTLAGLIAAGGLDNLKKVVEEYQSQTTRVSDLTLALRNAGAE
jgi:hypothetical protein